MPASLVALPVPLRSLIRSRVDFQLENLALRHQIGVLQLCFSKMSKCLRRRELQLFHSLFPMLLSFTTLLGTLSSIFRSRAALELENLALRHQIGILQRSPTDAGIIAYSTAR